MNPRKLSVPGYSRQAQMLQRLITAHAALTSLGKHRDQTFRVVRLTPKSPFLLQLEAKVVK